MRARRQQPESTAIFSPRERRSKSAPPRVPKGTIRSIFQVLADPTNAIPASVGAAVACISLFAFDAWSSKSAWGEQMLFNVVIPFGALFALLMSLALASQHLIRTLELQCCHRTRFGRKGLLVSLSSIGIVASCVYRGVFIASEGAALCRGTPSLFNAPAAGRAVATIGELAFVVQMGAYIDDTSKRLGITTGTFTASRLGITTGITKRLGITSCTRGVPLAYIPAVLAEIFSWTGVVTANARFFCCEYSMWLLIAVAWAWDSAELLHRSRRWGDLLIHSGVLVCSLSLFLFNALFEIPHFFANYERLAVSAVSAAAAAAADEPGVSSSIWECVQDHDSPIWMKRLPFFFCYFFGCSWCSVALSYRYLRRGYPGPVEVVAA